MDVIYPYYWGVIVEGRRLRYMEKVFSTGCYFRPMPGLKFIIGRNDLEPFTGLLFIMFADTPGPLVEEVRLWIYLKTSACRVEFLERG